MRISIQIETPFDGNLEDFVSRVGSLSKDVGAIVLSCTAGINPLLVGHMLKQRGRDNISVLLTCRDKNRIAILSDLLTARAVGLKRVIFTDGVHPVRTPYPSAKPVYDLDLLQVVEMVCQAREGHPVNGLDFPRPFDVQIGVCSQGSSEPDFLRLSKLLDRGIDLVFLRGTDGLERTCSMTEKEVYLSMDEDALPDDVNSLLEEAGRKGAAGLNIVVTGVEQALKRLAALKDR